MGRIEVYQMFGHWRGCFVSNDGQRAEDLPLHVESEESAKLWMAHRYGVPVESVKLRAYTSPIKAMQRS